MSVVECPTCFNTVEVKQPEGKLREHRLLKGISVSAWCPNGGAQVTMVPFASDAERGLRFPERNPGAMHEPKPYTGALDWDTDPVLHPFVD